MFILRMEDAKPKRGVGTHGYRQRQMDQARAAPPSTPHTPPPLEKNAKEREKERRGKMRSGQEDSVTSTKRPYRWRG